VPAGCCTDRNHRLVPCNCIRLNLSIPNINLNKFHHERMKFNYNQHKLIIVPLLQYCSSVRTSINYHQQASNSALLPTLPQANSKTGTTLLTSTYPEVPSSNSEPPKPNFQMGSGEILDWKPDPRGEQTPLYIQITSRRKIRTEKTAEYQIGAGIPKIEGWPI
jgi:hypothetical protein